MEDHDAVREALTGPVTSVSVPFNEDDSIDYDGLRRCLDFYISGGSKAMILTYGDSLYSLLSDQEVADVTKVVVEHTAHRALVVAADKQWATPQGIEFAHYCRETGADLLMVLPPDWALSCTPASLVSHYAAIAEHIPVMLVTNLFRPSAFRSRPMAQSLGVIKTVRDQVPGVVAIKDDVMGEFARRLALLVHDHWAIISGGRKDNHLDLLSYGCDGYFSTFSKFNPEIARKYWSAIQAQDWDQAREIIRNDDLPLFDILGAQPGGYDAVIHATFELTGLAQRWRRKPYYSLNDEEVEVLADKFKSKGWV